MSDRDSPSQSSVQWVELGMIPDRYQAQMEKYRLEEEGILVQLLIDDAGGVYPSLGFLSGAKLLVQACDLTRAQEILQPDPSDAAHGGNGDGD